jgi:hypothetical protein
MHTRKMISFNLKIAMFDRFALQVEKNANHVYEYQNLSKFFEQKVRAAGINRYFALISLLFYSLSHTHKIILCYLYDDGGGVIDRS